MFFALKKTNVLPSAVQNTSRRRQSTASSFAPLLVASTVVHMTPLPVPWPNDIPSMTSTSIPIPASISSPDAEKLTQELGKSCSQRDRMLQQAKTTRAIWSKNKPLVKMNAVSYTEKERSRQVWCENAGCVWVNCQCIFLFMYTTHFIISYLHVVCMQIYDRLDSRYADCPWPSTLFVILLFAPIIHKNSEEVFRKMHVNDKTLS